MRRHILTALFLFAGIMAKAQVTQYGKVTELNSGGKRLNGVSITVNSVHDCQPTTSDVNGVFRLRFGEHQTGDVVVGIRARKYGYEVVNSHITRDGWTLTDRDTLRIVMAPAEQIREAKLRYYDLLETAFVSRYDSTMSVLNEQLAQHRISDVEYRFWSEAAMTELGKAYVNMDDYAESLACLDIDNMDETEAALYASLTANDMSSTIGLLSGDEQSVLASMTGVKVVFPAMEDEEMKASDVREDFVVLGAQYADACFGLGMMYKRNGNDTEAKKYLSMALGMYETLNEIGNYDLEVKNAKKELKAYER